MELALERCQLDPDLTIGSLSVDGQWECWTLEDTVRAPGVKVAGETAIPYGKYGIDITFSPHFNRDLPLLMYVPMFSGVRIHPGNFPADTEGCILVGRDRLPKSIGASRIAFETLYQKLRGAKLRGEHLTLRITQAVTP